MDFYNLAKKATENELAAFIAAIEDKGYTLSSGRAGASPYSPETVLAHMGELTRGQRVSLTPIARSHNGAGQYKGRGRWKTLVVLRDDLEGDFAICDATDRDADEIGFSGLYVRPWATQEAEDASGGLGALSDAFNALGL